MKLSARRRIIIPFLFLVLIPVMFVGAFFYMNQRNLYLDDQIEINENRLNDLVELIKNYDNTPINKAFVISHIDNLKIPQMFIIEKGEIIYTTVDKTDADDQMIIEALGEGTEIEGYDLRYKAFNQWDWKLGILTSLEVEPFSVLKLDGVVIGIGIIFILFSLEAIILITDNFYKPVKILLGGYNDILSGNYQSEIDIDGGGEMGMLGMAFNDMRNTIAHRTNKAIQMRRMTDDILSSISTGIITTDIDGKIVKYNASASNMIGLEPNGSEDDYDVDVVKALVAQINRTLKSKVTINEVVQFSEHQKNEIVYYDITTSVMENAEGQMTGVICSFNDISQRKRVEERIERLDRMASLGQLSAGLAHEIRNPLSGMKMSTQVLHSRLGSHLGPSEEKMFSANIKEIDRLNQLITELLEFSKPQTPITKTIGVRDVLTHTIQFVQRQINDKQINIDLSAVPNELQVLFDENQMSQVFMNIISNAVEAMDRGGTLSITSKQVILNGESYTAVRFEDDGCGISEEHLKQVFDPFFTTRSSGTGLGLAVVHRLVTANYGEIEVASKTDEGTAFTIYMLSNER